MKDLRGQGFVDPGGIVSIPLEITLYDGLKPFSFNTRPPKTVRIEKVSRTCAARASRYQSRKWKILCLPMKKRSRRKGEIAWSAADTNESVEQRHHQRRERVPPGAPAPHLI